MPPEKQGTGGLVRRSRSSQWSLGSKFGSRRSFGSARWSNGSWRRRGSEELEDARSYANDMKEMEVDEVAAFRESLSIMDDADRAERLGEYSP